MATEYESLRLSVSLTDNVSAQLQKIRNSLSGLGAGPAGLGMERLKRQTTELTDHFKKLSTGMGGASEGALGIAKSVGFATAGVVALGAAVVKSVEGLSSYTTKMNDLGRFSNKIGINAADVKSLTDTFGRSGLAAEAATNIAGLASSMADLGRANSQLRQNLLSGLQGKDLDAMQGLIENLKKAPNDIASFGNQVTDALENVYKNNLARTKNPQLAAEARENFVARLGAPDLARLRERFEAASAIAIAAANRRVAESGELETVTARISQSWGDIKDDVFALATPAVTAVLKPLAESLAVSAKQVNEAVEGIRNFNPPEWLTTMGSDVVKAGDAVSGVLNQMNQGAKDLGESMRAIIDNFQPPEWLSKLVGGVVGAADTAQAAVHTAGQSVIARHEAGAAARQAMAESQAPAAESTAKKGFWGKITGKARGGPLGAGELSIVGEQGPELFKPNQSGTIIPNWLSTGAYGAALVAEMFGARGASSAAAGAFRGHAGATGGHDIGQVLAGGIPGAPLLQAMVKDSQTGHPMRTKLRALLGLDDPGEAAPWQKVAGRASGGPVTAGSSYMVGEQGPEAFVSSGSGGEGKRLVQEQTHQLQELNANSEDQSTQMRSLTEELAMLNRHLEGGGGGIRAQGGPGTGAGGGVRMGGLGGLPGFGSGGGGVSGGGGGGSSGGGGASGSWASGQAEAMAPSTASGGEGAAPTAGFSGGKKEFIEKAWPLAVKAGEQTGVDPRIIMAQSAVETGWGKHAPQNNYFGIKGKGGSLMTREVVNGKSVMMKQNFAGYGSMEESFQGYADFINKNKRYGELKGAQGIEAQSAALQRSGYATDPTYGAKVGQIAKGLRAPDTPKLGGEAAMKDMGGGHYPGDGHDHSHEGGEFVPLAGGVVNENQKRDAAIRKLAINAELKRQLSAAAKATGLEVDVYSGGQAKIGSGGPRTGSTRHDLGGAGDIKLRDPQTGRTLDMRNPADQKRMAKFTEEAVAEGATGVGAGMGYMGASSIHIGGGSKASWGGADWVGGAHKRGLAQQEARKRARFASATAPDGRSMLDADGDRSITQKVEGTGKLTVDVNAPAGTKVAAEGSGIFKEVETNRQVQMAEAAEGPTTSV